MPSKNETKRLRRKTDPAFTEKERRWKENGQARKVPAGHRLRGVSKLVDEGGELLKEWQKTERRPDDPPAQPIVPPGFTVTKAATMLDRQGQALIQWVSSKQEEADRFRAFEAAAKEVAEKYAGIASAVVGANPTDENLCTLYPYGDPHLGMLAWGKETGGDDFDLKIAEREMCRATDLLVRGAPPSKLAIIAPIGDLFHTDDDTQLTPTSKHKLDVEGRWLKMARVGLRTMVYSIDRLREKHERVVAVIVPGNHDIQTSRMMALWLEAFYRNEPRVEVMPNANPFTYIRHGKCLFGFNHGMLKPERLAGIMAADRPQDWGETIHRMWFVGHLHKKESDDFPGCSFERLRTLAPRDNWTNEQGYRSKQSIWCATFDAEFGEVHRETVSIERIRA